MKFAFFYDSYRPYNGLISALSEKNECIVWSDNKPIFDMLDETTPDYCIYREENQPDDIVRAKRTFKSTKFIELPNDYPKIAANVWNVPIVKVPTFDILIVGDLPDNIEYFAPLLNSKWSVKIVGDQSYPVPEYLGRLDNGTYISLIDQTKIAIVFNEQSVYNLAARKCCVLSPVKTELFPSVENHIILAVESLLNGKQREKLAEKAYNKVMDGNTYHDRADSFLRKYKIYEN